ncbi:hypothetical protein ERS043991_01736, partial [Streptococcus pneumoniae]
MPIQKLTHLSTLKPTHWYLLKLMYLLRSTRLLMLMYLLRS